jgi:hypothetical protein
MIRSTTMASDQSQHHLNITPAQQDDYRNFLQRFQADPTSISAEEAARRYRELLSVAPPAVAAEVQSHVLGQLPHEDRQALTLTDTAPDSRQSFGLDQLLGKDSFLNTPMGRMLLSAAAAYLMKRLLSGQSGQSGAQAPATPASSGIGDILSGLLGGANAPGQSGGGLGDILSGLLGGASGSANTPGQSGGGLGDILSGLLGGAAQPDGAPQEAPRTGPAPAAPADPADPNKPVVLGHIKKDG